MIGHVNQLRDDWERMETVKFDLYLPGSRLGPLTGEMSAFRNRYDETGLAIARLVRKNKLFWYRTLACWREYPSAFGILQTRLGYHCNEATRAYRRRYEIIVYDHQAQSSLTPAL